MEKYAKLISETKKWSEDLAQSKEQKPEKKATDKEIKEAQERIEKIKKSFAEIFPDGKLWEQFEKSSLGKDPVELANQFPESWKQIEKETEELQKKLEKCLENLPQDLSHLIKDMTKGMDPRKVMKMLPSEWKNPEEKPKVNQNQIKSFFEKFGELGVLAPKDAANPNAPRNFEKPFQPGSNSPRGEGGLIAGSPKGKDNNQVFRTPKGGGSAKSQPMKKPIGKAANLSESEMRALAQGKNSLSKANEGGNPSFGIKVLLGQNTFGNCQATLYQSPNEPKQKEEECLLATARHCLMHDDGRWSVDMMTAYGAIQNANVELNDKEGAANDIAKVRFSGETCRRMKEEKVPVLKLRNANPNEEAYLGTRYFNRLHQAYVLDRTGNQVGIRLQNLGVHTGDSGGGLFVRDEKGDLCLAGVLSCAENEATVHETKDGKPTIGALSAWYSGDTRFLGGMDTGIPTQHSTDLQTH
jgi:hypothetical protein